MPCVNLLLWRDDCVATRRDEMNPAVGKAKRALRVADAYVSTHLLTTAKGDIERLRYLNERLRQTIRHLEQNVYALKAAQDCVVKALEADRPGQTDLFVEDER